MRCMNKSGQFYLVAAMVVIAIVIGFATISNSSRVTEGSQIIYSIEEKLEIEAGYVLDYCVTNDFPPEDTILQMETFAETFTNSLKDMEFYLIFGQEGDLVSYKYFNGIRTDLSHTIVNVNQIQILVDSTEYLFNQTSGGNFHYVIVKEEGNEKYIAANEESFSSSGEEGGGSCIPDCSGSIDSYTKLLLHMDDTGLTDEIGKTVTFNADAHINTSNGKFNSSVKFDGTGDYLSIPDSADWDIGTADFTVDFWAYPETTDQEETFISTEGAAAEGFSLSFGASNVLRLNTEAGGFLITTTDTISTGAWVHIAVVRSSGNTTIYKNGVPMAGGSSTTSWDGDTTSGVVIGRFYTHYSDYYFQGYMDEVRISKGIARWTTTFTSPTAPYPPDKTCGSDGCTADGCGVC